MLKQGNLTMDKSIHHHVKELMEKEGVVGALCADKHGLCLENQGMAQREWAGNVVGTAIHAKNLHPNVEAHPVICIETENSMTLIKTAGDVTTAIFKQTNK